MPAERTVEVFLNGESRHVPNIVEDEETFRICLRLPQGMGIAYADHRDEPLEFFGSHVFVEGDQYVTTGLNISNPERETTVEDASESWLPPTFEGEDPDAWKNG
jgi:hypothetical protein